MALKPQNTLTQAKLHLTDVTIQQFSNITRYIINFQIYNIINLLSKSRHNKK